MKTLITMALIIGGAFCFGGGYYFGVRSDMKPMLILADGRIVSYDAQSNCVQVTSSSGTGGRGGYGGARACGGLPGGMRGRITAEGGAGASR